LQRLCTGILQTASILDLAKVDLGCLELVVDLVVLASVNKFTAKIKEALEVKVKAEL
jgi:hypothetical protein